MSSRDSIAPSPPLRPAAAIRSTAWPGCCCCRRWRCSPLFVFWPLGRSLYLSTHGNDIFGGAEPFVGLDNYAATAVRRVRHGARHHRRCSRCCRWCRPCWARSSWCCCWRPASAGPGASAPRSRCRSPSPWRPRRWCSPSSTTRRSGSRTACSGTVGIDRVNWLTDPSIALPAVCATTVWMSLGYNVLVLSAGIGGHPARGARGGAARRRDRAARLARRITVPLLVPAAVLPRRGLHDPRAAELRPDPHPDQGRPGPGHHHAGVLHLRARRSPSAPRTSARPARRPSCCWSSCSPARRSSSACSNGGCTTDEARGSAGHASARPGSPRSRCCSRSTTRSPAR